MHMLSKKIKLRRNEHSKKVQNPSVVLTANREVHIHEEAQAFVHDLNQFVTVQLLVETSAVPSLGKLCEDQGYSYEWVSGQKPRFDQTKEQDSMQDGKFRVCYPRIVVKQDSSSSCSRTSGNRSDNPKSRNKNDKQTEENCLRDLPGVVGGVHRKNSKIHILKIQIRNVVLNWYRGMHSVKTQLSQRQKLRNLLAKQNDKGSLQKTFWCRVHRVALLTDENLRAQTRALPDLRKGHKKRPCTKKRCARRAAWDLANKCLQTQKD